MTSIGASAFSSCSQIANENLILPQSLTTISNNAFYHCNDIKNITFLSTKCTIGESAFSDCSSLQTVDWTNFTDLIPFNLSIFNNCDSLTKIYLKNTVLVQKYSNDLGWKIYKSYFDVKPL